MGVVATGGGSGGGALPPPPCGIFPPGATLLTGQSIVSCNQSYTLTPQADSNLVLSKAGVGALWATMTIRNKPVSLVMQVDGNLVLFDGATAIWSSGTNGNPGAYFQLRDNGNGIVYSADGATALWATHTANLKLPCTGISGGTINPGERYQSCSNRFYLTLQTDGNAVVYDRQIGPLWMTSTNNGASLIMQADGNLVLYPLTGPAVWNSQTSGNNGAVLVAQDDGNFAIYHQGAAKWATGSFGMKGICGRMTANQFLVRNEHFHSCNGVYRLYLQGDGNLVLYSIAKGLTIIRARWATMTNAGGLAVVQGDGNFVLYTAAGGTALFHTNTWMFPGASLHLQNDGNLVVYDAGGTARWATMTLGP